MHVTPVTSDENDCTFADLEGRGGGVPIHNYPSDPNGKVFWILACYPFV